MPRLLEICRLLWAIALTLLGLAIGTWIGYASAGWIGAICLGTTASLVGAFLGGPGGLELMLRAARLLEVFAK